MTNHIEQSIDTLFIDESQAGIRLDKILANQFKEIHSRTYFQNLIEQGMVLINGSPIKKRLQPKAGDEVQINFFITQEIGIQPENIPLDIIYEDEFLIAVNKPAGMVVHPATGNWSGTFVNALVFHCSELLNDNCSEYRPGIVHRLDKDTSGLLIAAKNSLAQQRLIALFSERKMYKEYIAICLGNPGEGEISAPIGRHPVHRQKMAVVENGKPALSIIKTLATDGKISIVQVILATGRTHQIRVHLKHRGTPVLGDGIYGNPQANEKYGARRQLLHARKLRFTHPITGKLLDLEAPIPADISLWLNSLSMHTSP